MPTEEEENRIDALNAELEGLGPDRLTAAERESPPGTPTGQFPPSSAATGPLEPVYDYLAKHQKIDPKRISFVGFSKSAQIGLEMARFWQVTKTRRPILSVVAYYIGNGVPTPRPEYPAILFLHGDKDSATPWERIVKFRDIQKRDGKICEYKIYKNTTHSLPTIQIGAHITRRTNGTPIGGRSNFLAIDHEHIAKLGYRTALFPPITDVKRGLRKQPFLEIQPPAIRN